MRSTFIDFADEKDRLWKVLGRIRRRQAGRNSSAGGARKRPSQVFRREGCARSRRIGDQWTVPHAYGWPQAVRKGKPARRSNIKRPGGA